MLVRTGSYLLEKPRDPSIEISPSDLNRFPTTELRRVAKWIEREGFDVVHTHMSRANTFGVLLRLLTGVKVIATAHANHFQPHWRLNDFVIANSQATYDYQVRINRVQRHKIRKVFCYTNLDRFDDVTDRSVRIVKRQLRLKGDEFLIGVVGEVLPRKGQMLMAKSLRMILQTIPNAKVVFLGRFHREESYPRQIRRFMLQNGLSQRTKWLGIRDNVEDFMAAFDLCVVPSYSEPLGLVAIEALAARTPVVAADVGGLPEIVEHEKTGLLFRMGDKKQLANAVIRMARSPELRQSTSERGRESVLAKFDPGRLTEEVLQIYSQTAACRAAA